MCLETNKLRLTPLLQLFTHGKKKKSALYFSCYVQPAQHYCYECRFFPPLLSPSPSPVLNSFFFLWNCSYGRFIVKHQSTHFSFSSFIFFFRCFTFLPFFFLFALHVRYPHTLLLLTRGDYVSYRFLHHGHASVTRVRLPPPLYLYCIIVITLSLLFRVSILAKFFFHLFSPSPMDTH